MNKTIRAYFSEIGTRGGQSCSVAKVTAARRNSREAGRPGLHPRPVFIPRTGETELHLMPGLLERHGDRAFMATEKIDGFSFSFGLWDGAFILSARDRVVSPTERSVFAAAARELDLEGAVRALGEDDFILQTELIGPGIRGNRYQLAALQVRGFDLLRKGDGLTGFAEMERQCARMGLETVPVLERGLGLTDASAGALARGRSLLADTAREGVVFRTEAVVMDPFYGRVSCKVFNPDFQP